MAEDEDNPDYLTTSDVGGWHVNKLVWSDRQDCYQIVATKPAGSKGQAWVIAQEWAKQEGIEVR